MKVLNFISMQLTIITFLITILNNIATTKVLKNSLLNSHSDSYLNLPKDNFQNTCQNHFLHKFILIAKCLKDDKKTWTWASVNIDRCIYVFIKGFFVKNKTKYSYPLHTRCKNCKLIKGKNAINLKCECIKQEIAKEYFGVHWVLRNSNVTLNYLIKNSNGELICENNLEKAKITPKERLELNKKYNFHRIN